MDIYDYWGKRVKIIGIGGGVFTGHAAYYTSELDDPDGVASLSIEPDDRNDILISFTAEEIASIEVLPADTPVLQEAV